MNQSIPFSTKPLYISTYCPLVKEFADKISAVDYDKIPEPFLPVHGEGYETTETRIAFVGMETRGWGNMTKFVDHVGENPEEAIFREFEEFNDLEFCNWGNNFGSSFWDFNFKFLANFHGVDDWKKVKRGEMEDILKSFAWGNTNSIERYGVTAEKNGVNYQSWVAVKHASKCFDNGKILLDVLRPHIMVILSWGTSEEWLIAGIENVVKQEIDDHFWYYFLPTTQTHVLWTAHPTWLAKNVDFDEHIKSMVTFVKQRL
jgi:hypothetical protein